MSSFLRRLYIFPNTRLRALQIVSITPLLGVPSSDIKKIKLALESYYHSIPHSYHIILFAFSLVDKVMLLSVPQATLIAFVSTKK